jgi:hypothetical protein
MVPLKDLVKHNAVNKAPRPSPYSKPDTFDGG